MNSTGQNFFAHHSAFVDPPCDIGNGTKIWHFSHIMPGAHVGENCNIGQNVFIDSAAFIGNNVKIQNNVSVYSGVIIKDWAFIGPSCVFTNILRPRSNFNQKSDYLTTIIEQGATIGANSTILCGISIGQGAFIAAGAVVTKDVPEFTLVVGNPARFCSLINRAATRIIKEKPGDPISP
jgi:UDP-2-acetamido-3-amino-2,3-dideoxy-glucuronate N-acetyltransferase